MIEVADCPALDMDSDVGKQVEALLRLGGVGGWARKMGTAELHWRQDVRFPGIAACGRTIRPGELLKSPTTPQMRYCEPCAIHYLGSF